MDLDTWERVYASICADFGFDPEADGEVAETLADYVSDAALRRIDFSGEAVAIAVGADLDAPARHTCREADRIVATGDAVIPLETAACPISLVVTDLDSAPATVCARTRRGGLTAVHAHGDNAQAIARWVPRMHRRHVIGTTQGVPHPPLVNVGGFTDGDRAAYLAHACGAAQLDLVGWDLGDQTVGSIKRRKLDWAARLLTRLESVRNEHYDALDGHRTSLDAVVESPVDDSRR